MILNTISVHRLADAPMSPRKPLFWMGSSLKNLKAISKHGIATPRTDVALVRSRYKGAREHYRAWRQQMMEEHDG